MTQNNHSTPPHTDFSETATNILERTTIYQNRLEPEDAQEALEHVQTQLTQLKNTQELIVKRQDDDLFNESFDDSSLDQIVQGLQAFIIDLHPADLAFILESLPRKDRSHIWNLVPANMDGDVLLELDDRTRDEILATMNVKEIAAATEHLETDEIAELVRDLPKEVLAEVQQGLTEEERRELLSVINYPEDSVGNIMDFEMVRVRDDVSLEVVLRYLRRLHELPDHTDQLFIVDRNDKLQGSLPITTLLVSEPDTVVSDVMKTDLLTLSPLDDPDEAAAAFERYDLVSAPVVDDEGHLIGRVTIDEIVDVIRETSEEQALSQAGLHEEDIFSPVFSAVRNRAPWLLVNLCTASTASFVASRFEDTVGQIVILAFLMSIVAGIGGNTGNQTMTMIIRALAVGRITSRNIRELIQREFLVSSIIGIGGGTIAACFAWAISGRFTLGLVMMVAMLCNMLIGAGVGILVPMTRAKFDKDPAIGSSVLLTFATDTMGFLVFLGLASLFLL